MVEEQDSPAESQGGEARPAVPATSEQAEVAAHTPALGDDIPREQSAEPRRESSSPGALPPEPADAPESMAAMFAAGAEPSVEELALEGVRPEQPPGPSPVRSVLNQLEPGSSVHGVVSRIERYGAFVDLQVGNVRVRGLVHISELSPARVNRVEDVVALGQEVNARVLSVDPQRFRVGLSLKGVPQPWQEELAAHQARAEAEPDVVPAGDAADARAEPAHQPPARADYSVADLQRRFGRPEQGRSDEQPKGKDRGAQDRQRQQELMRRLRGR
jgi:predicted RNA-binding protein with RPS1 domain